jgi:hypothetical protein
VEIPFTLGFRPQLIVVSGLWWESLYSGIFGYNGAFGYYEAISQYIFFTWWNLGYHRAFHDFSFTRWNLGYHGAFHEFFFRTMELRLSQSLSQIFFSSDGIQAITEPFTNFFFHMMEFRLSRSLSWIFSFIRWNFARHIIWGKTPFVYITKSIYIRSASLKTLPLDLGPPLQGKEYDPFYSKLNAKSKCFFPETTYSSMIQVFYSFTEF